MLENYKLITMKELSIEEKAKRYDEAQLRMNKAFNDNRCTIGFMNEIFPELTESEDERIRTAIIHFISHTPTVPKGVIDKETMLAWLEKQEEQKPTLPKWKYKKDHTPLLRDSLILNKYGCVAKSPSGAIVSDVWVIDYDELVKLPKEELEKQGEQKETLCDKCKKEQPPHSCQDITALGRCALEKQSKSFDYEKCYIQQNDFAPKSAMEAINEEKVDNANKVEPKDYSSIDPHFFKPADKVESKFKIGDWVVYNRDDNSREIIQVYDIRDGRYYFNDNVHFSWSVKECDEKCHLWTIQDAKDGDVLNSPSHRLIWIYKDNEHYHVCVNMNYVIENTFTNGLIVIPNDVCPATKDNQTILFSTLKETGYEWNTEKRELKKIEQNPAWSEEDKRNLQGVIDEIQANKNNAPDYDLETYDRFLNWLKSLKERVQPQPKQEWSVEDKSKVQRICQHLNEAKKYYADITEVRECIDWLKSLHPQSRWKPSETEINVLECVISGKGNPCNYQATLQNILAQLKAL